MKTLLGTILAFAWTYCAQANPIEIQVNQPIPDGDLSGLASTINLSGLSGSIGAVQLDLNISGTYNGDLYAYLVHDGGFSVLLNRPGRTASDSLGYGDGGLNVTFADGAANGDIHNYRSSLFGNASTALSGPLTGTWSPDGRQSSPFGVTDADARTALLSSFDGVDPNGDWTLFVADLSGGDLHQLNSWGLELNGPAASVPDPGSSLGLLLLALPSLVLVKRWCRRQPRLSQPALAKPPLCFRTVLALTLLFQLNSVRSQPAWFHGFPLSPPHQIPNVAAGWGTMLGLKTDGTVLAASDSDAGQLNVADWTNIISVAAGFTHAVGLKADGSVVAVGDDHSGQCDVNQWNGIVTISAGWFHTVGLRADGKVMAVGLNENGQCNVSNWTDIVAVSTGAYATAGLKSDGSVVSTLDDTSTWSHIVDLAIGGVPEIILGVKDDGTVIANGYDVSNWSNIVAVAGGQGSVVGAQVFVVGLKADGTAVATGDNLYGQCDLEGWSNIVQIAAGLRETLGLKADGTVVAAGHNTSSQRACLSWYLGPDGVAPIFTRVPPNEIAILGGPFDMAVSAVGPGTIHFQWLRNGNPLAEGGRISGSTTAAIRITSIGPGDEGTYTVAAENEFGRTVSSPVTLRAVPMPAHQIPNIAAGAGVTVGIKADGTVRSTAEFWPTNWSRIIAIAEWPPLGVRNDGTVVEALLYDSVLAAVTNWTDVIAVAGGQISPHGYLANFAAGLRADGTVLEADEFEGLEGSGPSDPNKGASDVNTWREIVAIAASFGNVIGLKADGTVVSTRRDGGLYGEGNVGGWRNIKAIASGYYHTVGLQTDGTVVAVGQNDQGQCNVSDWRNIVAIAASGSFDNSHTVGLREDGTVVAVGGNDYGQCNVGGWSNIVAVAAGEFHTIGLKADGTVVAVGDDDYGQCDTGSWNLGSKANQAPVAGTYQMATSTGLARSLSLSKLEEACSDPDGDSFSITAVSSDSAAGGYAQLNGASILYTPPAGFLGSDSFSYTVSDSRGASSQGTVYVTVTAPTGSSPNVVGVSVASDGSATVRFAGIPGVSYLIEASTDLVHWDSIGSAIAGANGLFEFVDPQARNYTSRYYRSRHDPQAP